MINLSQNQYCNNLTYALIFSFFLAILFFLTLGRNNSSPVSKYIFILYGIFVMPRLLMMVFSPELVVFPFEGINISQINAGMTLFLFSTIALFFGLIIGEKVLPPNLISISKQKILPRYIFIIFISALTIEIFLNFILQQNTFNLDRRLNNYHFFFEILRFFSATDVILFASLIYFFTDKARQASWAWVILSYLSISIVFSMSVLGGSRSGSLRLLQQFIAIYLVVYKFKTISFKSAAVFFTFIFLFSIISWPLGSLVRNSILYNKDHQWEASKISTDIKDYVERDKNEISSQNFGVAAQILNRLSIVDYAILLPYASKNREAFQKFSSPEYIFKSTANAILPGNPFSDSLLSTSRSINIIFRGASEKVVLSSGYFSEFWTSFSLFFLLFGFFSVGIHFLIGLFLHVGYVCISKIKSNYVVPMLVFYTYLCPGLILFTMGIDHTIQTFLVLSIQFFIFFGIYKSLLFFSSTYQFYKSKC